jgi:hypothetical protein
MAQEESMKLAVEIVNRAGPVLKDLQRSMRSLAAETTAAHKLGQLQAKGHTEALFKLRREVNYVADRVKCGLPVSGCVT